LCGIQEKPTAQTAHLVFAYAKSNAEKLKELFLANYNQDGSNCRIVII
jgi:hypothetical protein